MSSSILNDVKKVLGLQSSQTEYDIDILMHINSVLATLHQLGIGPDDGFSITDATATWDAFVDDVTLNQVRTYVSLQVRMWFDPPSTSYHTQAMKDQLAELQWRLNARREETEWTDPLTTV